MYIVPDETSRAKLQHSRGFNCDIAVSSDCSEERRKAARAMKLTSATRPRLADKSRGTGSRKDGYKRGTVGKSLIHSAIYSPRFSL